MAGTLAESPGDPFHRKLRQLCCFRRRFDCYRMERTSFRAGVSPAEVQRLFTAHFFANNRIEGCRALRLFTFDQFSILAIPYHERQPALPALEEVMEYFAELMQRLLEIQSGGTQRSAELITEDRRLMEDLQKRHLQESPTTKSKT